MPAWLLLRPDSRKNLAVTNISCLKFVNKKTTIKLKKIGLIGLFNIVLFTIWPVLKTLSGFFLISRPGNPELDRSNSQSSLHHHHQPQHKETLLFKVSSRRHSEREGRGEAIPPSPIPPSPPPVLRDRPPPPTPFGNNFSSRWQSPERCGTVVNRSWGVLRVPFSQVLTSFFTGEKLRPLTPQQTVRLRPKSI